MEVAVALAATGFLWILSATVLLPFMLLLKYNESFQRLWFTFIYVYFIDLFFASMVKPFRRKLFQLLEENLAERDKSKPLKVLEIGIAGGYNLEFYPENSHLTAVDVNANFLPHFLKNQKKFPNLKYERTVISRAENMKDIEDSSMDVVVATYVLCSVYNMEDVLKEIKRVLKPGGKYVFLEHDVFPKSDWKYTLQKFAHPLWTTVGASCVLLRKTADGIHNAGFSDVICVKSFPGSLFILVRALIYGVATK